MKPNYFEHFGLPVAYQIDGQELRKRYIERSRAAHPDFHRQADATTQAQSLDETAVNNLAFRVLNQSRSRLLHLLFLHGLMSENGENLTDEQLDPMFLMEMMERNEAAEFAEPDQRDDLLAQLTDDEEAAQDEVEQLMLKFDQEANPQTRLELLRGVVKIYLSQQYYKRLRDLLCKVE